MLVYALLLAIARRHRDDRGAAKYHRLLDDSNDGSLTLVMVGSHGSGKTSLINRWTREEKEDWAGKETVGTTYFQKTIELGDGEVAVELWDCSGNQATETTTQLAVRRADVVVFAFDLSSDDSWAEISGVWLPLVEMNNKAASRFLIGIKRKPDESQKFKEELDKLKKDGKIISFHRIDASSKQDVDNLFKSIAAEAIGKLTNVDTLKKIFQVARKRSLKWAPGDLDALLTRMQRFMFDPKQENKQIDERTLKELSDGGRVFRGIVFGFVMDKRGSYPRHWAFSSVEKRRQKFFAPFTPAEIKKALQKAKSKGWGPSDTNLKGLKWRLGLSGEAW